jgi:hypothetical protein
MFDQNYSSYRNLEHSILSVKMHLAIHVNQRIKEEMIKKYDIS